MEIITQQYTCIKILTIFLPLICLLLISPHFVSSSAHSPPSSVHLAANVLRTRGYSLFATALLTLPSNYSGTLLAPPDFTFSRRPPPRLTTALLHYHTLKPPRILTSSLNHGHELLTLYQNNCLFISKNSDTSEISISSTPYRNPISAVKIRQLDLYVDDNVTVHGIDSVLDPDYATKCASEIKSPVEINRIFLDHAIRALRRTGFGVVAAAMGMRSSDLLSLSSFTIFAVSDSDFFRKSGRFQYDFRHYVLPIRRNFSDFRGLTEATEFETLAGNRGVVVNSVDGAVKVNGLSVGGKEVYHDRWMVVLSVTMSSVDEIVSAESNRSVLDYVSPCVTESQCTGNRVVSAGDGGGELGVEETQPSDGGD